MDILLFVLGTVVAVLLLVFAWRFGFQKSDPTKAKIPDHVKTGPGWKDPDFYKSEKQKRRERKSGA